MRQMWQKESCACICFLVILAAAPVYMEQQPTVRESFFCQGNRYDDNPSVCTREAEKTHSCLNQHIDRHHNNNIIDYVYSLIHCRNCYCRLQTRHCPNSSNGCHFCIDSAEYIGDGKADCIYGIDESHDVAELKSIISYEAELKQLIYTGNWRCKGENGTTISCDLQTKSAPFLHSYSYEAHKSSYCHHILNFWKCDQTKECVREGEFCQHSIKKIDESRWCPQGYSYSKGGKGSCVGKFCQLDRWFCEEKCIGLQEPCTSKCSDNSYHYCQETTSCHYNTVPCGKTCPADRIYCPEERSCKSRASFQLCPSQGKCLPLGHECKSCHNGTRNCEDVSDCIGLTKKCNGQCPEGYYDCQASGTPCYEGDECKMKPERIATPTTTSDSRARFTWDIVTTTTPPSCPPEQTNCCTDESNCKVCQSPEKPCNEKCPVGRSTCNNLCIPVSESCNEEPSNSDLAEMNDWHIWAFPLIAFAIAAIVIAVIMCLVSKKRKNNNRSKPQGCKTSADKNVHYKVTVERVDAVDNEFYGEEDNDANDFEVVETNPYYGAEEEGEEEGKYDVNIVHENAYYE